MKILDKLKGKKYILPCILFLLIILIIGIIMVIFYNQKTNNIINHLENIDILSYTIETEGNNSTIKLYLKNSSNTLQGNYQIIVKLGEKEYIGYINSLSPNEYDEIKILTNTKIEDNKKIEIMKKY